MRYTKAWLAVLGTLGLLMATGLLLRSGQAAPQDCSGCWIVVDSPNVGTGDNVLNGVAVVSPSYAWAAGYAISGTAHTLIERWNGSAWQVVSSPNVGTGGNYLKAITAMPIGTPPDSSRKVWAAGYYTATGSASKTLIERWSGTGWYTSTTPNRGTGNNYLNSIAVGPSNNLWAVGSYVSGSVNKTLVLSSTNDTSWATVNSPNGANGSGILNAVAVVSNTDVWAGGYYTSTAGTRGLILHLDATGWHTAEINIGTTFILGLSFRSANDGLAVGYTANPYAGALLLHWDGTTWTEIPTAGFLGQMFAVLALPQNVGWAAGEYGRFSDAPYAMARYGVGTTWSEGAAVAPQHESGLRAVAGTTITDVWTVGYYRNVTNTLQTLVEHNDSCPNLFVDLVGNVFYTAIHDLSCRGGVTGTDATHYSPAVSATRGQFAKTVMVGFGLSLSTPTTPTFTDVPANYFAYVYIESGYAHGILNGYDAATCHAANAQDPCYLPNRPITRAQLTKLVVSAAGYPPYTPTGGNPSFSDVLPNNVFFSAIETAHNKNIINGYPDGTFRPNNNIRRDEMAQMVYRGINTP